MTIFQDFFRRLARSGGTQPVPGLPNGNLAQTPLNRRRRPGGLQALDDMNFRFPASDNMAEDAVSERLLQAIKSFAPSQPTQHLTQFAGRTALLNQIITAIEEHRNHLVIFGGRGTGKTSLSLALMSSAEMAGYHCAYVSCSRNSTVDSIFRSALAELSIRYDHHFDPRDESIDTTAGFDTLMPSAPMSPQALTDLLSHIRGTRLLVVIDEYDRNENETLTRDITEIMKAVSDRDIPVQIVIVGVGDVVDNLVGEHASIGRVLYVVRLGVMSETQIRDVLQTASQFAGIAMEPEVIDAIVGISHGRPYIARLVGLKATKMALMRNSGQVTLQDFEAGTDELLGYLEAAGFAQVSNLFGDASKNIQLFKAILNCKRDSSDRFSAADVCSAFRTTNLTTGAEEVVERALTIVASPELGILNVTPGPVTLYSFVDPRAEMCISILCGRIEMGARYVNAETAAANAAV